MVNADLMPMSGFADAHLHPADMREEYPGYEQAEVLLGCSTCPADWGTLRGMEDKRIIKFYGVHPWKAPEWTPGSEERLRSILESDPGSGVGEIGLDSKRGGMDEQIPAFREQMSIAKEYGRPVQIHCVGRHKDVLDIIRETRPGVPIVIHAFDSESYAKPLVGAGCYLSVNPRILRRSDEKISRLLSSIRDDRLLLESDHPFAPGGFIGMTAFAERLSEACGVPAERLLSISLDNTRRIARWE